MPRSVPTLRIGLVGLGMIVDETYLPCFRELRHTPLYSRQTGVVEMAFTAAASRTGKRGEKLISEWPKLKNISGPDCVAELLKSDVDVVCIATPDNRHFEGAKLALEAGKHVLIEKPSVLSLAELEELLSLAERNGVLCKVVYHKLFDPDHKKLRTLVVDGVLQHVNHGYCSLLEPISIAKGQFAEWIVGRNPATYVAIHYVKLIDFTFGPNWKLSRVSATGQRGIVGPANGPTWDSVQLQIVYAYPDGREAAFDIHTSWVTPDNFPGYVEQEVQFRFDNAVWGASQRKRGVELTIEGRTPNEFKNTPNYHYNGTFLEPNGERTQRGYGIETIRRFFEQVAFVEAAVDDQKSRNERLQLVRSETYNDLSADRNCVAVIEATEAILAEAAKGNPGKIARITETKRGLAVQISS
ncbi:MAG: Gfo/Idh/MocA family oxidoreductase [Gemmataceae bacterium]